MLRLQRRKTAEIGKVIDGQPETAISMEEIMRLFGPITRDPVTNKPIIVDDEFANEFVIEEDRYVQFDSDAEDAIRVPARE